MQATFHLDTFSALGLVAVVAAVLVLSFRLVRSVAEQLVQHQRERFAIALNNMRQGLLMFDEHGHLILSNRQYAEMYRLNPDDVRPGSTLRDVLWLRKRAGTFAGDPDGYAARLIDTSGRFHGDPDTARFDEDGVEHKVFNLPDGRMMSVTNRAMPGGGWVATHTDITDTMKAAQELERTKTFLDTIVENCPATLLVKDANDLRYILVNRAGEAFLGMSRDQLLGRSAHDIFPPAEADAIQQRDRGALTSGRNMFLENMPVQMPVKGERLVTTNRITINGANGQPQYLLSVLEDVTERRRVEAQIEHMATHDPLTDLPNRAAFARELAATLGAAQKAGESFAILCIDLDRFKEVNDVFGHGIGDDLLRAVSQRLKDAAGEAFLARLGGDEFTLILAQGEQPAAAEELAGRLLQTMSQDIVLSGQSLRVGLSIGVAIYPSDGVSTDALVSNADAALYRAKAQGRGTFCFFESNMDQRLRERRALQHELGSAIACNELMLHYQPQAQIGGEVTGFEALVRWQHPTRGVVAPAAFIPIAEESGLILAVGEWILREACREAASWPKPLRIAVNLSPVQFRHGDLPGLVHQVLLETGLSASRLELEITEGVLIGDFSRAVSILRRLKALGVRIAMDDFGTGYSSLSYLQSFPFDKIKIDRTFISSVDQNPQSAAIVRAVIGLGRGLDLPIVAEGVETDEQLAFLSREACTEVQGYLVGRPQTIGSYEEIIGRTEREPAAEAEPADATASKLRLAG